LRESIELTAAPPVETRRLGELNALLSQLHRRVGIAVSPLHLAERAEGDRFTESVCEAALQLEAPLGELPRFRDVVCSECGIDQAVQHLRLAALVAQLAKSNKALSGDLRATVELADDEDEPAVGEEQSCAESSRQIVRPFQQSLGPALSFERRLRNPELLEGEHDPHSNLRMTGLACGPHQGLPEVRELLHNQFVPWPAAALFAQVRRPRDLEV